MPLRTRLKLPDFALSRLTIALLAAIVIVLALVGLLTITRETPVDIVVSTDEGARPPAIRSAEFPRAMELYTGMHLEPGNGVAQLLDGDGTYPILWRELRGATRSIAIQMYYSMPSSVADTLNAILVERARAGVRVRLLLDAFGSQELSEEWRDALIAAGVQVRFLRPLHWFTLHKAANRSHVRVVAVDGRIGYTGGFGLADYWLGNGRRKDEWRETNVRFTGPAVDALQVTFAIGWAEATGVLLTGPLGDPPGIDTSAAVDAPAPADPARVPDAVALAGLLFTQPTDGSTAAERFLALTIAGARERLWIANSYFVPSDEFRRALERAAQRGVDVRILTAGEETDVKTTRWAGRARYESLLESGVRIYEYTPTMIHAKTIVADGVFGTIGSMNFDNRSLAFNAESNLVVLDTLFARAMEQAYEADLRHAKQITLPEFRRRPLWERMLETGATLLSRVL